MADLFILGRLRAPATALEREIKQFAKNLAIDERNGLYTDNMAFIPVGDCFHLPHTLKEKVDAIAGNLFDDYAIGLIHGSPLFSYGWVLADPFRDRLHLYGRNSKLWRRRLNENGELEKAYEIDASEYRKLREQELEEENSNDVWEDEDGYYEDGGEDLEDEDGGADNGEPDPEDLGDEFYPLQYSIVEGEFRTEGLARWLEKFRESKLTQASKARLLILITRGPVSEFLESDDGRVLKAALGDSHLVAMRSEAAAIIVFENEKSRLRYDEVVEKLRPRVVEDFIFMNIGLDIAVMHPGLSPLADWAQKRQPPARPRGGPRVLKPINS